MYTACCDSFILSRSGSSLARKPAPLTRRSREMRGTHKKITCNKWPTHTPQYCDKQKNRSTDAYCDTTKWTRRKKQKSGEQNHEKKSKTAQLHEELQARERREGIKPRPPKQPPPAHLLIHLSQQKPRPSTRTIKLSAATRPSTHRARIERAEEFTHAGARAKAEQSEHELVEQVKWLVPMIASLKFQLHEAKKMESAARDRRMKKIASDERKMHEEKLRVALSQKSAVTTQESADEWESEATRGDTSDSWHGLDGWYTTEENIKAKNAPQYTTPKEDNGPKPTSERKLCPRDRSRSTDEQHKRTPTDILSEETSTRCWQLEPQLQIAMVTIGLHSFVLPGEKTINEAFKRTMHTRGHTKAEQDKIRSAFSRVRAARLIGHRR